MADYHAPRVLLAGTNSGCGKTTLTCALLQALVDRGLKVSSCKCGPDYIDPMFHSRIIGAKSTNLDPFFFAPDTLRSLLVKNAGDSALTVIEGVMGYYDGIGAADPRASSYEVAKITDSPVVLVVGVGGASLSVLAVIQGFLTLYPDNNIRGVILNRCSPMLYPALAAEIRRRFGPTVEPLGYLPAMPECTLESRHLGLVTAAEVTDLRRKLSLLSRQAQETIDLDGLLRLAKSVKPISCTPLVSEKQESVRIAVARDKAFCFYYEDSLDVLREMGAELVDFSPLADSGLPENIHGLYLGGGYPELYTEALSENIAMRSDIRAALSAGLPCIAECGGFMYLTEHIAGAPMVGFLPGGCTDKGRLVRFGYVELTAQKDNLLCQAGESIRGHEFHHWDADDPGDGFTARRTSGRSWDCVVATPTLYAGFPHFHFCANPAFARNFYQACLAKKGCHTNPKES